MRHDNARLAVEISRDPGRIAQAQRLRYRVFAEGLGASLPGLGIDEDRFDVHCEHLLARDTRTDAVVGTYRILNPEGSRRAGGYCGEEQFDLAQLDVLRERMVEVGR